jgi:hypothetical protein
LNNETANLELSNGNFNNTADRFLKFTLVVVVVVVVIFLFLAKGWTIRVLGFDSWQGLGIFLFTTTSRMALGPTQPPIQWVPGVLSLGVMQLGHEANHSPPSSAKVKNVWSYTSTPPMFSWHSA